MKKILLALSILIFTFSAKYSFSQIPAKAIKLQAIYIYNFMLKIQWPENKRSGDFIIGILGNTPLISELNNMAEKRKINSRNIVVKNVYSDSDLSGVHLLFIPGSEKAKENLTTVIKNLKQKNGVLIVSETEGLSEAGSIMNFVLSDSKLRFELNQGSADRAGFKTSGLSKYAILR